MSTNKHKVQWECYRPMTTLTTFIAHLDGKPNTTVIVKKSYDDWLFHIDENRFSLDLTYNVVKDLASLSEEEFFQESLIWGSKLDIHLVLEIQKLGYQTIYNFNRGPIHSFSYVEY